MEGEEAGVSLTSLGTSCIFPWDWGGSDEIECGESTPPTMIVVLSATTPHGEAFSHLKAPEEPRAAE